MRNEVIAKKYAKALFESISSNKRDKVLSDLNEIAILFHTNTKLERYLYNKFLSTKKKYIFLSSLLKNLNFDKKLHNFILLLTKKNKLYLFKQIISSFEDLNIASKDVMYVKVELATSVDQKISKLLTKILEEKLGKKILLNVTQNSALIGGAKLYFNSSMYDFSIESALNRLRKNCLNVSLNHR